MRNILQIQPQMFAVSRELLSLAVRFEGTGGALGEVFGAGEIEVADLGDRGFDNFL